MIVDRSLQQRTISSQNVVLEQVSDVSKYFTFCVLKLMAIPYQCP